MANIPLKRWEKLYLTLALHINKFLPNFVESYYGPPEIKDIVNKQKKLPFSELKSLSHELMENITKEDMEEPRKNYLLRHVQAMETIIERLAGKEFDFLEEVELYFDIIPYKIDDFKLDEANNIYNELTKNSIEDRITKFKIPQDKLLPISEVVMKEVRNHTLDFIPLPREESLKIELVSGEDWAAYNWYLGNFASRMDLNLERNHFLTNHVFLITHEGYPGHHTEHCLKEKLFYRDKGFIEHSLILTRVPQNVISEGIGEVAHKMIFPERKVYEWIAEHLSPLMNVELDPTLEAQLDYAKDILKFVPGNCAYMLYKEKRPEEEVIKYFAKYKQISLTEAEKGLRFTLNPHWAPFIYNYSFGKQLVENYIGTPPNREKFVKVLTEQILPSQLQPS